MRIRSIADVIQAWREYNEEDCTGKNAASAGSVSFNRQVLYSYHMPIACYHLSPIAYRDGFVLVSSRSPSITTSRHISNARRESAWRKFSVPDIGVIGGYPMGSLTTIHDANIAFMLGRMDATAKQAIGCYKQRDSSNQWLINSIADQHANLAEYVYLAAAGVELPDLDDILRGVHEERERLWVQWSDPKAVARRERAAARREAIKALNIGELTNG
jgi:hypothetical protein